MGVSLNCNQGNVVKPNFKGSYQRTENGTPYYKTNSGTVAGAVMAVPAGLAWVNALTSPTTKEELEKKSKNIIDMFTPKNISAEYKKAIDDGLKEGLKDAEKKLELNKVLKKRAIPCAIIAAGVTLGCGMLVDALRNKRARESAEFVKQVYVTILRTLIYKISNGSTSIAILISFGKLILFKNFDTKSCPF